MMHIIFRSKYLTILTCGILAASFSSADAQVKSPEAYFHPAKPWSVKKTDKTCSIGTVFNNGFILNFYGGTDWVKTLNINFRQNIFKNGSVYNVTFSIPGTAKKTLSATARSGEELALSFHGHKQLYQDFRKSAVVDVSIEGNEFRFYLSGFTNAAGQFERCMSGADLDKKPTGDLKVSPLVAKLTPEQRKNADLESFKPRTSKNVLNYTENETKLLEEKIKKQKSPMPEAPVKAVKPEKIIEPTKVVKPVEPEPVDLKSEKLKPAEPITAIAPLESAKPKETIEWSAKPKIEEKKVTKVETKEEKTVEAPLLPLKEVEPAPAVEPKAIAIKKKTPPVIVEKKITRAEADFTNVRPSNNEIIALQNKIDALQKENKMLNDDLNSVLKDSEQERMSVASENWNLESATMKFNEAERQIKRLGQQLQKERAQHNAEKKELEAMLFDPQVTDEAQLARLANLEEQIRKMEVEMAAERARYEQQIRMLQGQ